MLLLGLGGGKVSFAMLCRVDSLLPINAPDRAMLACRSPAR